MAIDNNSLCYLFDPIFQVENIRGIPIVGGHIEVFIAGTDQKYITWQNFDGARNPFKIPLNNDGRATILVEPNYTYDAYIYDSFNNMVCSRLNIRPVVGGDIVVSGITQVWHDESLSGDGTLQSPLTVVSAGKVYSGVEPIVVNNDEDKISAQHVPLGLQEPLYFVEDSESACIIGCSAQSEIPSAISGKWEEASNVVIENSAQWGIPEGTMNESAFSYDASSNITAYNGSAFKAGDEFPESATEAINVVTANSATWNGPYVPLGPGNTADNYSLAQGDRNKAIGTSLAQGVRNIAEYFSFTQGEFNSANSHSMSQGGENSAKMSSLAQGTNNTAEYYSFTQGEGNSANDHSMSQGGNNTAKNSSLAQGTNNSALNFSIAQGVGNTASNGSQAFGQNTIATAAGMAIGKFNLTEDAAFVIGNGTNTARRDIFVIDHSGNVSAQGDISASGISLTSFYTDYQTNSANFITALPEDLAYTGWVESSIVSATSGLQPSGNFISFSDLNYGVINEI